MTYGDGKRELTQDSVKPSVFNEHVGTQYLVTAWTCMPTSKHNQNHYNQGFIQDLLLGGRGGGILSVKIELLFCVQNNNNNKNLA